MKTIDLFSGKIHISDIKWPGLTLLFFAAVVLVAGCGKSEWDRPLLQALKSEIEQSFDDVAAIELGDGIARIIDSSGALCGYGLFTEHASEVGLGFRCPVPAIILCDRDGKILKVTLPPNGEDGKYLVKIEHGSLLNEWCGYTVGDAAELPVDTVTGATYSSRAIITSVDNLLQKHKNEQYGE